MARKIFHTLAVLLLVGMGSVFGCGGTPGEEMEEVAIPDFDNKSDSVSQSVQIKSAIAFGQEISETFNLLSKYHGYTFAAAGGSLVEITLTGVPGENTDTVLMLYGPKGESGWTGDPIIIDDNGGGGKNSKIDGFALPAAGEYLIIASCKNVLFWNKSYRLKLGCESQNCSGENQRSCGDGACDGAENCQTCAQDCGACPTTNAEWTVLVYLSSDTHDDGGIPSSLDEMTMKVYQNSELVNLLFLEDPPEGPNTKLYRVTPRKKEVVKDFGELHMGKPETLVEVIKYVRTNYPSKRFFLDLIGHTSSAISAFLPDYYPASPAWEQERMMYWQVRQALLDSGAAPVDLLALSGCGTGDIQNVARMSDVAKYVVGLQEYNTGYTDVRWADSLMTNPAKSVKGLAVLVAEGIFKKGFNEQKSPGATGAYDTGRMGEVETALAALSATLTAKVATNRDELVTARQGVQQSKSYTFEIDAYHFAEMLIEGTADADIQAKAAAFRDALDAMIVAGGVPNCADEGEHANAHGVNIVFITKSTTYPPRIAGPEAFSDGSMSAWPAGETSFYQRTGWAGFVTAMY